MEDEILKGLIAQWLMRHRYLRLRGNLNKTKAFSLGILPELDVDRFRQFCRMSPEGFEYVYTRIKDHVVFTNNGNRKQVDPSFQLAVALHRFGSETANGSSCMNTGQIFGIGQGTAVLYTKRVIIALMSLWQDVIKWHDEEERRQMRARLRIDSEEKGWDLFENCIGIADGTLLAAHLRHTSILFFEP
ncbi:hypothetical protein BDZ91DRAFT_658991 [Kalaharituber pfeilii]|nr:hypothetical protein BDZ91DRAFT_658991 [Kalaharituber pfeilii]